MGDGDGGGHGHVVLDCVGETLARFALGQPARVDDFRAVDLDVAAQCFGVAAQHQG